MIEEIEDEDEIITEDIEEEITFTREEITALLNECKYSFISYENPIARSVIHKMTNFLNYTEIIEKK